MALHEVQGVEAADAVVLVFEFAGEGGVLLMELGDDLLLIGGFIGEGLEGGFHEFEVAFEVFEVVLAFDGFAFEEFEFVFEALISHDGVVVCRGVLIFHVCL